MHAGKREDCGTCEREAAAPAATEALRAVIESYRYSRPLLDGTPEHRAWKRNEETLDAILADLAALASPEPTPDSGLDVERLIDDLDRVCDELRAIEPVPDGVAYRVAGIKYAIGRIKEAATGRLSSTDSPEETA